MERTDARVKPSKLRVAQKHLLFWGMKLSEEDLCIAENFQDALQKAPRPENIKSLRSLLGLLHWQKKLYEDFLKL